MQTSTVPTIDLIVSFCKYRSCNRGTNWLFLDRRGNKQLTAICASNNVIYLLAKGCYIWRNKQRDREWNALSREVRK